MKFKDVSNKQLNEYFDGELNEKENLHVCGHVKNCPICMERLELFKKVSDLIEKMPKKNAPLGFTEKVLANLPEKPAAKAPFFRLPALNTLSYAAIFLMISASAVFFGSKHYFYKTVNVTFEIAMADASVVTLAGDFNNWNMYATALNDNENGVWSVTLPLKKGTYQYSIIVDGKKWYPDPQSEITINKKIKINVPTNIQTI